MGTKADFNRLLNVLTNASSRMDQKYRDIDTLRIRKSDRSQDEDRPQSRRSGGTTVKSITVGKRLILVGPAVKSITVGKRFNPGVLPGSYGGRSTKKK